MLKIGAWVDFNPYISVRGLNIFNDHLDPILIPLSLIHGFLGSKLWFYFILESGLVLLSIFILRCGKVMTLELICFSGVFIFANRGILSALGYPIHPSTWTLLPMGLLCYGLINKRPSAYLWGSISLCFFKEIYPILLLPLALYYLVRKIYPRMQVMILIFCSLWTIFYFFVRPRIWGDIYPYANAVQFDLFKVLGTFTYKDLLYIALPSLPLLFWMKKEIERWDFLLLFWVPLVIMHIMAKGSAYYQYGVIIAGPLVFFVLFHLQKSLSVSSSKMICVALLVALLSQHKLIQNFKTLYSQFYINRSTLYEVDRSHDNLEKLLTSSEFQGKKIFATAGAISRLNGPHLDFYQKNSFTGNNGPYDYYLVSIDGRGQIYPHTKEDIVKMNDCVKKYTEKILYKDTHYLFVKGSIPYSCIL